jgi:hypothetical protein
MGYSETVTIQWQNEKKQNRRTKINNNKIHRKVKIKKHANTPIFPVISFLPHFLYTIYVWLNYPLVWNMYKVCAAGRYALNKQSTNKHKITMWENKNQQQQNTQKGKD